MRVLLLTVGSQGDVEPFVALASRLRPDGHEAVLAAPALCSGLAAARDVPFVPLDLNLDRLGAALAGRHGLRHLLTFCRSLDVLALAPRPGRHDPLRAAGGGPVPVLHAYRAHVVPRPADCEQQSPGPNERDGAGQSG